MKNIDIDCNYIPHSDLELTLTGTVSFRVDFIPTITKDKLKQGSIKKDENINLYISLIRNQWISLEKANIF